LLPDSRPAAQYKGQDKPQRRHRYLFSADPANPQNQQNSYDQIRPVLQRILAERFHLKYRTASQPMPGYVATVAKNGEKLAEAKDPTAPNSCQDGDDKTTPGAKVLICTSSTIGQFLSSFGEVFDHPVIDHTGLKKSYDITARFVFGQAQMREEYIRIVTDALKQQLGLVITPGDVWLPVMVIDGWTRPRLRTRRTLQSFSPRNPIWNLRSPPSNRPRRTNLSGRLAPSATRLSSAAQLADLLQYRTAPRQKRHQQRVGLPLRQ
jgi:uncharacterized protein (TIGR03435 family)